MAAAGTMDHDISSPPLPTTTTTMDPQKMLARAILLPLNFDPFKPPKQRTPIEKLEERERNRKLHRLRVRQNIIYLAARASPTLKDPPDPNSHPLLAIPPEAAATQLIRNLQPNRDRHSPRTRNGPHRLNPDTPLPPASSINTSTCSPATANLLRTLVLLDEYDQISAPANSRRGSLPPAPPRQASLPSGLVSSGPLLSASTHPGSLQPSSNATKSSPPAPFTISMTTTSLPHKPPIHAPTGPRGREHDCNHPNLKRTHSAAERGWTSPSAPRDYTGPYARRDSARALPGWSSPLHTSWSGDDSSSGGRREDTRKGSRQYSDSSGAARRQSMGDVRSGMREERREFVRPYKKWAGGGERNHEPWRRR
ncbi:hypothetical protein K461DRAFT_291657 [Myriangium duriaei CBS 260.36]|uniref:Uncharacterized protein n=1 Tax=Myriangium duriaei CBS 260.36 TaxID=1168546 RepID=A0A9P4MJ04_9PEZI|nr:hypothetical protein K461DRAFT_291657 [Myriangium duriaei CBS 260.36]